ncbi:MAG: asparagine--tRNA ligase [Bernardetiaceae bacterium]
MPREKVKALLQSSDLNRPVSIKGWLRSKRGSKNVHFLAINDGSCLQSIQVVVDTETFSDTLDQALTGACLSVEGQLVASTGSRQSVEVHADSLSIIGTSSPAYKLQKKKHSLEFLREIAHLRMRTNTFGAVFRIRHHLAYAVHHFFHQKGFYYLHTPIITGSDAEGAGDVFRVTTLPPLAPPLTPEGDIDFKADFFGKATNLSVSGQLEAEVGALALGEVYTFGPTFRAENSNTARHLSEFWMIEPEMAFYELPQNMDLAEEMIQFLVQFALTHSGEDLQFLDERFATEEAQKPKNERSPMGLIERLQFVVAHPFARITYTEAIQILEQSKPFKKGQFQFPVSWGTDLQSEHERFLVEKHFKKPVIVTDYPKSIKSFYMKQNPDGQTVRAMDVLFPGIGEIIGGSQREEDLDKLETRMQEMNIPTEELWWYLDLRRFGTAPHSGFGLGFERLVQFVTGMGNIRDVIPFPRTPKNAEF